MNEFRQIEVRRLLFMVVVGLVLGYLTGYWIISQWVVSLLFIGWMLSKLYGLQNWLDNDQDAEAMPDSDGVWEQITYTAHRTQRKYEQHKQSQQDLLLRFNNIMAALPDAKILLNSEHIIQWSNQAALELLGIDPTHDVGQRVDNLIRKKKFTKLLNNPKKQGKTLRLESPHDASISLSIRLLPVQPGLYLLSARNISQQIHLNDMRRAFIANASHELRTPLTVLSGYLELFDDDPELPEHLKPAIEQARTQGVRMQQIISDMLKLSQLENSERNVSTESTIDIPAIINSTATALQKTIAADSHTLTLAIDESIKIRGVEKDITSVITNLLENAI
ncbi:MAG: PAS domain-containing sensor histidine kinase (Fragment), partial [uncultured Thiotrichaceae bacterium]